jgi:hypothetical protein
MSVEIWKDIPGYEGLYQVSDVGRVRRLAGSPKCKTTRILKPANVRGYHRIALCEGGKPRGVEVHRLVAWAFIGPQGKLWVNHKNGIRNDNRVENIEYGTPGYNTQHAYDHGFNTGPRGEKNRHAKLTDHQVWEIRMIASHMLDMVGGRRGLQQLYRVSQTTIQNVLAGTAWKHVEVYP